jgi:hypothetical protein
MTVFYALFCSFSLAYSPMTTYSLTLDVIAANVSCEILKLQYIYHNNEGYNHDYNCNEGPKISFLCSP